MARMTKLQTIIEHLGKNDCAPDKCQYILFRNTRTGDTVPVPTDPVLDDLMVRAICDRLDIPYPKRLTPRRGASRGAARGRARKSAD